MANLRLLLIDKEIHVLLKLKDLHHLEQTIRSHAGIAGFGGESGRQEFMHEEHMMEAIRQRAYALYEERGFTAGDPEQDWFQAEAEILGNQHNDNYKELSVMDHAKFDHLKSDHGEGQYGRPESRELSRPEPSVSRKSSAA